MIIETVFLSLIIGLLKGGSLTRLKVLKEKRYLVLILGVFIQIFVLNLNSYIDRESVLKIMVYAREIYLASSFLIFLGIILNYKTKSLWISLLGFISNFVVIFVNSWKMPILKEGLVLADKTNLIEAIENYQIGIYSFFSESTKFGRLSDIIVFSKPYPLPKLTSIGDFLIGIGIFIFIQDIMSTRESFFRK